VRKNEKKTMKNRYIRPLLLAASLMLTTGIASAHAHPKVMEPGIDSIGPAPAQVSIRFTEGLEPKFSSIQVSSENGATVTQAKSTVDAADATHMTLVLPALKPGSYSVHWVAIATDGHRTEGTYHFTVK
jgi:copper resistance protein C